MNYLRFPLQLPFVDALAAHLLQKSGADPLLLARTLVLLPTRRSCRSLRDAFLRASDGKPLLLPRIMPIGEVDDEADIIALVPQNGETVSPEMPEKRRLAMLTRLIMQAENTPPARSYQLATELARLLDEVTRQGLNFEKLGELAPLELAAHWQKTTEFLNLITRQWPRILAAEGKEDAASLMRARMLSLAAHWKKSPPDFPVIAAGSTGSIPATAELLIAIANMPQGSVILPGLDDNITEEAWDVLEPTHPQYGLKKFLEKAEAKRSDVKLIGVSTPANMTSLFAPALLTARWREEKLPDVVHISLMQADTQAIEARMIAYKLREALDSPDKTAALITPDRTLARMVSAECARYNIAIDDSAGTKLNATPAAIFMRLLLDVADSGAAPHALLALLRHPLAIIGQDTAQTREYSRLLEKHFLRGVRLTAGLDALVDEVKNAAISDDFTRFMQTLRDIIRPLELLFLQKAHQPLEKHIETHIQTAEGLSDANLLWAKESGIALADLLRGWQSEAAALGDIKASDYPALFDALLSSSVVRKPYGTHPRLHILSPLEARLLHFDLVILGEMNEGTWPASIAPDPWMSAPMRDAFGLPSHAAHIGQSAHDVWMLLHAREVIMTRAAKIFGKPATPSRWWVRLVTLISGHDKNLLARMDISSAMQATIAAQDAPYAMQALTRPAPTPPANARPRSFSVSDIDRWCKDAYSFYASKILRLRPLPPLDEEPSAGHFGDDIHAALEAFSAEHPAKIPDHAYQILLEHGRRIFTPYLNRPAVMSLWWPRFESIARNFLAREKILRAGGNYTTQSEVEAAWKFDVDGKEITLKTRADRVDVSESGFRLIDYKTGTPPSAKNVTDGKAKQLPLTALALIRSGTIARTPQALVYWALKTRENSKDFVEVDNATELLSRTEAELISLIEQSLNGTIDYAPEYISPFPEEYDDYAHLTRRAEWGS